jgi:uncharacterized protein
MSPLADREKQLLLDVARRALTVGVEKREFIRDFPDDQILRQSGGAFVTLRRRGRLRGCVGRLPSKDPLIEVVADCAKAAALEDPRFKPVRAEELPEIEIELSILSTPQSVTLEQIEAGKHGLVVSHGWQRGVLLPQVATEFKWEAARFLEETCVKAGLEREAWKDPQTRVQAFTAEVFSEQPLRHGEGPFR